MSCCRVGSCQYRRADTYTQIYLVGSFFVYGLYLISLLESKPSPTAAHLSIWVVGLVFEAVLVARSLALYTHAHYQPTACSPGDPKLRSYTTE